MIYLYVKTHNITGLKYLGKTVSESPLVYPGSGKRWKRHLKKHGNDVTTQFLLATDNKEELKETGLFFSKLWNIVDSEEWANIIPESGDGGDTWTNNPNKEDTIKKITSKTIGQKRTQETCQNISAALNSKDLSYSGKDSKNNATFIGRSHKESSKMLSSVNNRKEDAVKRREQIAPYKMDEEFRRKCSENNKGKPKSANHKEKLRSAQLGRKPGNSKIIVIGEKEFVGMVDAAKFLGVPYSTLRNRIKSKNIHYSHIYEKRIPE